MHSVRGVARLTSFSWGSWHTCISWEAWGTWGSLFSRSSRWARPPRLPGRPLDGPDWGGVAGNLVEDGCVPGHVTWDRKDKDSFQSTVTQTEDWRCYLSRLRTILSEAHAGRKHTPLKYVDFQSKKLYILFWILTAGLYSSCISCIWNSTAHVSISVNISWTEVINFIFTPVCVWPPKSSPSCHFSSAIPLPPQSKWSSFQPTKSTPPYGSQIPRLFQLISLLPSIFFRNLYLVVPAAKTPTSFILKNTQILAFSPLVA